MKPFLARIRSFFQRFPVVSASILIILVLSVANYFLWQWHRTLSFRHAEVRADTDKMLESMSGHTRLEEQVKLLQEATDYIDRNLINPVDLAGNQGYFYQLETVSRVRLVDLQQLQAPATSEENPYVAVPFSVRATGTYRQLMSLINEIEQGPHISRITQMDLLRESTTGDVLSLNLTVTLLGKR